MIFEQRGCQAQIRKHSRGRVSWVQPKIDRAVCSWNPNSRVSSPRNENLLVGVAQNASDDFDNRVFIRDRQGDGAPFSREGLEGLRHHAFTGEGIPAQRVEGVRVFKLDVTDRGSIKRAVSGTIEAFGRLFVVVNNAGYGIFGPFEGVTREQIRRQFDTNLFGVFDVTRAVLPHLRDSGSGVLINISSMAGLYSLPFISLYASSKFAMEGFTECLFYELEPWEFVSSWLNPVTSPTQISPGTRPL